MKSKCLIICAVICLVVSLAPGPGAEELGLKVKEMNLCRRITEKGMEGGAQSFPEDTGTVCLWAELYNVQGEMQVIHSWYYGDRKKASFKAGVNQARNISQSCKEIDPAELGLWTVKVFDLGKKLLGEKTFMIKGIPDKPERMKKNRKYAIVDLGVKARAKSGLKIASIKVGRKIKRGKLAGETANISSGWKKVFCWVDLPGVEKKSSVKFVWYYFKKKMAETVVNIKPPSSQAWAFKTMRPQYVGEWCVEVLDGNDVFIREVCFKVKQ